LGFVGFGVDACGWWWAFEGFDSVVGLLGIGVGETGGGM
jgi:hypothetical protein